MFVTVQVERRRAAVVVTEGDAPVLSHDIFPPLLHSRVRMVAGGSDRWTRPETQRLLRTPWWRWGDLYGLDVLLEWEDASRASTERRRSISSG